MGVAKKGRGNHFQNCSTSSKVLYGCRLVISGEKSFLARSATKIPFGTLLRIGTLSSDDVHSDLMGQYGTGKRNVNGDHLLSFMGLNDLYACNTTFLQPVRRRTSRIGSIKDWSAGRTSKKTIGTLLLTIGLCIMS